MSAASSTKNMHHKILMAARARFRRYGLRKTNMREIAADVGVAVGTLYRYFANKDAIVLAFIDLFKERHQRAAAKILGSDVPADEKLREYMLERFRAAEATRKGSPHAAEITTAVLRADPGRLEYELAQMVENVTVIVREGCGAGLFSIADVERDVRVFLYATAAFFPMPPINIGVGRRRKNSTKSFVGSPRYGEASDDSGCADSERLAHL